MPRFDLDLSAVKDEYVLIPEGYYEVARIAGSKMLKGEGADGKPWAMLSLSIAIQDEDVTEVTGDAEPTVNHTIFIPFDKETGKFNPKGSPDLGKFLKLTGFVDLEEFEDGTEEMEDERNYVLKCFENMGVASIGVDVLCKVTHTPDKKNPDLMRANVVLAKPEED